MKKPIVDLLFERALKALQTNSSIEAWAESVGIRLFPNQVEILNTMMDDSKRNLTILAARSAGKTYAVALATVKLCLDNPGYTVIFFAPKQAQSTRILEQIRTICDKCRDTLYKEVDWNRSNQNHLRFVNGSRMLSLGCAPRTQLEGFHCFSEGTLITLANGSKRPIEDISVGDLVLSRDLQKNEIRPNFVTAIGMRIPKEPLYEVTYEVSGKVKTLRCTGEHKFYTKNRGEVQAKDLTSEDVLVSIVEDARTINN